MAEDVCTGATRRSVLSGIGVGLGAIGAFGETSAWAQENPKTFVLVHGSWHGGWCWRRVADILEKGGHKVYTPTLTGLGERSHLMSGLISLDTHVIDVANVIKWEGLENIVLVGDPARSRVTRPTSTKAQSSKDISTAPAPTLARGSVAKTNVRHRATCSLRLRDFVI